MAPREEAASGSAVSWDSLNRRVPVSLRSRESAAISIALKGKVTNLVAKLAVKGEAQAALEGACGDRASEERKAERVLVDALVQDLDATNGKDKKVASADADAARSVVDMASPLRDGLVDARSPERP